MTKNPFLNALAAIGYIVLVVILLSNIVDGQLPNSEIFVPFIMLSLFTVSVSVMGYILLYNPLLMLLDGKKREAVRLFLSTVGIFAGVTLVLILSIASGWLNFNGS